MRGLFNSGMRYFAIAMRLNWFFGVWYLDTNFCTIFHIWIYVDSWHCMMNDFRSPLALRYIEVPLILASYCTSEIRGGSVPRSVTAFCKRGSACSFQVTISDFHIVNRSTSHSVLVKSLTLCRVVRTASSNHALNGPLQEDKTMENWGHHPKTWSRLCRLRLRGSICTDFTGKISVIWKGGRTWNTPL